MFLNKPGFPFNKDEATTFLRKIPKNTPFSKRANTILYNLSKMPATSPQKGTIIGLDEDEVSPQELLDLQITYLSHSDIPDKSELEKLMSERWKDSKTFQGAFSKESTPSFLMLMNRLKSKHKSDNAPMELELELEETQQKSLLEEQEKNEKEIVELQAKVDSHKRNASEDIDNRRTKVPKIS